jgi:hypothetical protein
MKKTKSILANTGTKGLCALLAKVILCGRSVGQYKNCTIVHSSSNCKCHFLYNIICIYLQTDPISTSFTYVLYTTAESIWLCTLLFVVIKNSLPTILYKYKLLWMANFAVSIFADPPLILVPVPDRSPVFLLNGCIIKIWSKIKIKTLTVFILHFELMIQRSFKIKYRWHLSDPSYHALRQITKKLRWCDLTIFTRLTDIWMEQ